MHKQWIRMEQIYLSFQRYLNRYLQVVTAQWCWRNTRVLLERYYSILKQVDIAGCCETDFAVTTFEMLSLESSVHWKQGLQILRFQGLFVVCFFFFEILEIRTKQLASIRSILDIDRGIWKNLLRSSILSNVAIPICNFTENSIPYYMVFHSIFPIKVWNTDVTIPLIHFETT